MGKFLQGLYDDLKLHVRQSAWLHSAPERPKSRNSKQPAPTRIQELLRQHGPEYEPPMPDLDSGGYLLDYFWEIGPFSPGATYPVPLSHLEIQAWQHNTGIELSAWQARTMRSLSEEYVAQLRLGESSTCLPPWSEGITREQRAAAARSVRAAVRAMAGL